MRLINTTTLELHSFFNRDIPPYAILSHCWGDDEVSLQDLAAGSRNKAGFKKIVNVCRLAKAEYDLDWAWVDTCCIDKTSSAELSESINSMYRWYQKSVVCYAFLTDVNIENVDWKQDFVQCRWFKRGWTLQELLAPSEVRFFDIGLRFIGTKEDLAAGISIITRIPETLLQGSWHEHRTSTSVACRMSWASHRKTTREEDIAYCLLGIFDINMPLLYGEGRKAFQRLQEHIVGSSTDESIFAWMSNKANSEAENSRGLLASSPKDFAYSGYMVSFRSASRPPTTVINNGMQVHYAIPDLLQLVRHGRDHSQLPQWISILLVREATCDGVYHREDPATLLARQVNLSLQPRFYAKIYVSQHREPRPLEGPGLDSILDQYRHHRWLRYVHTAHLFRSRLDWNAMLLVCFLGMCFPDETEETVMTLLAHYLLMFIIVGKFADMAFELFRGERRVRHLGLAFLTATLVLRAPAPLQLAAVYTLTPDISQSLAPYRIVRPVGIDNSAPGD
ncbi:hypothetical protein PRZ48_001976 [Zasmidium cellare]|uniref:Heterokaryon incompatibility domain-containing protein n=1 Tax=Zasmidium cellare TaxID=395010 RepID=A0ABR0F5C2_ZASCE|nr:hypothetical protein PRZ48_001976 [Zasmidium cellare]